MKNIIIKIENMSKSFGRKNLFQDFNLEIEKGTVYAIIGPNGSGKTTITRFINDLISNFYNGNMSGDCLFKQEKIAEIPMYKLYC